VLALNLGLPPNQGSAPPTTLQQEIIMAEMATKLPIKTEAGTAPATAPAHRHSAFDTLRRQIDNLFDDLTPWSFPLGRAAFNIDLTRPFGAFAVAPATDVAEKDGEYEITTELPGLDDKSIEVKVADGTLTIKGEKQEEKQEKKKDYYVSERRYGSFFRSFALPDDVDADKIEASFAKGVLTVKLPKSAQLKKDEKKIQVKAA
jgi:HSP20 family protein